MPDVLSVLLEVLRSRLWVVPSLAAVASAVAAFLVLLVDPGTVTDDGPFATDAESARSVLSAISGAMITFTALVFSITMLVLQQAAAQLSPRVMRTFLRDRSSQVVLGLFVASFVFSLLVLLGVKDDEVSRVGLIVAVGLVLASILAFVGYIDHMAHAIRPNSVIHSIGAETRDALDRCYPLDDDEALEGAAQPADSARDDPGPEGNVSRAVRWSGESGYIQALDEGALVAAAAREGHDFVLRLGVGSFIVRGSAFVEVVGGADQSEVEDKAVVSDEDFADAVVTGNERTMSQDPEFGFRQLVDIALRALSPSLNDPTTAVQVIDELHALLHDLLERPIPSPRILDGDGVQVRLPSPDWDAFVHAAVDEIALAGAGHDGVLRRLAQMLADLERESPPSRLPALRRAADLVGNAQG